MNNPGAEHGREALVEAVTEGVLAPAAYGVLLYGDIGMGKSTVANRVAAAIADRFRVHRIRAEQSLTAVSYGALFHFLTGLKAVDLESPLAVLRAVRTAIVQNDDGDAALAPLLIVDDLHHLDDSSSHVLEQLVMAGDVKILAMCRSWESQPREFLAFCQDGLLTAVELPPLTDDEVRSQVENMLGGAVASGTVQLLMQKSLGNPQLLSSLVQQAVAAGDMVQSNGIWLMLHEPRTIDPAVADMVKGMVKGLDGLQRRALEIVALSGELPAALGRQLLDGATVQSLQQLGLLACVETGDDMLRLRFPSYAAVVRSMVPAGRSLELLAEVLSAADQVHGADLSCLATALAVWGLDNGRVPPADDLLQAARTANHECHYSLARRLAAAADAAGSGAAARFEFAWACIGLADLPAALEALESPSGSRAVDPEAALGAALVRVLAAQRAEDWSDQLAQIADDCSAASGSGLLGAYRQALGGGYPAALASLRQGRPGSGDGAAVAVLATTLMALCHAETGQSQEAADAGAEALKKAASVPSLRRFNHLVLARTVEAFLVGGRYSEAEQALRDYRETAPAGQLWFSGIEPALSGLLLFRQGRMKTALQLLTEAAEWLRREDHALLLPTVLGSAAAAAVFLGDAAAASFFRSELSAVPYGAKPARLVAQALSSTDAQVLVDLAADARSAGWVSAEKDIQEHRLLLGDRSGCGRLVELTEVMDAPDARSLHVLALALESPEAEQLEAAAEQAAAAGKHMLAATALAYAAQRLQELGLRRKQHAVLLRLRLTLPLLQGAFTPTIAVVSSPATALTIRERQIAQLVCQGATNKQIAQTLTLSPRTAEGHLYRIYLKLGVAKREDLLRHPELFDS
ncbi:MAG: LuxR C-terminal-related transcriptional regulator [Actinomycetota bacterium]